MAPVVLDGDAETDTCFGPVDRFVDDTAAVERKVARPPGPGGMRTCLGDNMHRNFRKSYLTAECPPQLRKCHRREYMLQTNEGDHCWVPGAELKAAPGVEIGGCHKPSVDYDFG